MSNTFYRRVYPNSGEPHSRFLIILINVIFFPVFRLQELYLIEETYKERPSNIPNFVDGLIIDTGDSFLEVAVSFFVVVDADYIQRE